MGQAKLYGQKASGIDINGIIKNYYVYAGENISAGDFVEFVNGIASTTTVTSSDTVITENDGYGRTISACKLTENKVFIAHGTNKVHSSSLLYGIVCTIDGVTITKGTETQICATSYTGAIISAVSLSETSVFIAHSYGSNYYLYAVVAKIDGTTITAGIDTVLKSTTKYGYEISVTALSANSVLVSHSYDSSNMYLYGIVCTVSDTTISNGTDTQLSTAKSAGFRIASTLLQNGSVFIAHSYGSSIYLYGIVCTISGTTITKGTDTALSTDNGGVEISLQVLSNGSVFIAHSFTTNYHLYGIVCTISGTTITKGTDTALIQELHAGYEISSVLLSNGTVAIFHGEYLQTNYLCATIPTINGTTVTAGSNYNLNTTIGAGDVIDAIVLPNDTIFTAHGSDSTNYHLNAQIFGVTDNIPTNNIAIPTYETQVRKTTTPQFDGVAKTSGIGGDETGHNDLVSIYTLGDKLSTSDGKVFMTLDNKTFLTK